MKRIKISRYIRHAERDGKHILFSPLSEKCLVLDQLSYNIISEIEAETYCTIDYLIENYAKKGIEKQDILKFLEFMSMRALTIAVFIASNILSMFIPVYIGKLFDRIEVLQSKLLLVGIGLICTLILEFFLNWLQNYLWFKMIYKGTSLMRETMFRNILSNPISFFKKDFVGDYTNRMMNDVSSYSEAVLIRIPMLLMNLSTLLIGFLYIGLLNKYVAVFIALFCAIYFLSYLKINSLLRKKSKIEAEQRSKLLKNTANAFEYAKTSKLFQKEDYLVDYYKNDVIKFYNSSVGTQKWKSMALCMSSTIADAIPYLSTLLGIYLVTIDLSTIGSVFAIFSISTVFNSPIKNLTDYNLIRQQAIVNEKRLDELLCDVCKHKMEIGQNNNDTEILKLSKVTFSYKGEQAIYYNDVELHRGQRIGIVGKSGRGKSTLLKMIIKEISPDAGTIEVYGRDISEISEDYLYKRIAVVEQDSCFLDDSVLNNILVGRKLTDKAEQIIEVLELNKCRNNNITTLSGGEKRRVAIARALISQYDLLILDEPFEGIDYELESKMINYIDALLKKEGASMIVVTHKDKILDICNDVVTV